jgi:LysM repeat protein
VVQRGDNLYRISLRFGTTVSELQRLNGIWSWWIHVGQVLAVPGDCRPVPTPKPTKVQSTKQSGHGQPKATPTPDQSGSGSTDVGQKYYAVRRGDNLFRIGLRFGVSVPALQAANGLRSNLIYVGQVLRIP